MFLFFNFPLDIGVVDMFSFMSFFIMSLLFSFQLIYIVLLYVISVLFILKSGVRRPHPHFTESHSKILANIEVYDPLIRKNRVPIFPWDASGTPG